MRKLVIGSKEQANSGDVFKNIGPRARHVNDTNIIAFLSTTETNKVELKNLLAQFESGLEIKL